MSLNRVADDNQKDYHYVQDNFYRIWLILKDVQLCNTLSKKTRGEEADYAFSLDSEGAAFVPFEDPIASYAEPILPPLSENEVTIKQVNLEIKQLPEGVQGLAKTIAEKDFSELAEIMTNVHKNDSNLKKLLLKEGTGPCPDKNQLVIVNFVMSIEGIDDISHSTYATRIPHRFHHRMDETCEIFDEGVATMHKGEISKFLGTTLCSDEKHSIYDFVEASKGEVIRRDARILIQIELVDVQSSIQEPSIYDMSDKEKRELDFKTLYEYCENNAMEGNWFYEEKLYENAAAKFLVAIECASFFVEPMTSIQIAKVLTLNRALTLNLAYTYYHLSKFKISLMYSEALIECKGSYIYKANAYYWSSHSLFAMKLIDDAYDRVVVIRKREICPNVVELYKKIFEERQRIYQRRLDRSFVRMKLV